MKLLCLKKHNRLFNIGTDRSDFFEEIAFRGISLNPPSAPSRVKLISNVNKGIKAWRRVSLNPTIKKCPRKRSMSSVINDKNGQKG